MKPVRLADRQLHLRRDGVIEILPKERIGSVTRGPEVIVWDPEVDGILGGEGIQTVNSDHLGERHLDGDELLFVIDGSMTVVLESGKRVVVGPGEAWVVPRAVWHHLEINSRCRYMFLGGGRTEIRPAP